MNNEIYAALIYKNMQSLAASQGWMALQND